MIRALIFPSKIFMFSFPLFFFSSLSSSFSFLLSLLTSNMIECVAYERVKENIWVGILSHNNQWSTNDTKIYFLVLISKDQVN